MTQVDQQRPGNAAPGSADVPVGMKEAEGDVGKKKKADEDVGMRKEADEDVGAPRKGAPGRSAPGVPRGWYSRGYLPHYDAEKCLQSVTYRLADSLPQEKLRQLEDELRAYPENHREAERRKRIEAWLDAGMGCCALRHPEVARQVQDSLLHFHGERYHLHAWCVMPNHVHVLLEPVANLAAIVQGWKSFTARRILRQNERLTLRIPEPDRLWMREYWDRYIRDAAHYQATVDYIQRNPVKAHLCHAPEEWMWSSAWPGSPGSAFPGSADVLVGMKEAEGDLGMKKEADGDVGKKKKEADEDVGKKRKEADGDVGAPRKGAPRPPHTSV